MACSTYPFQLSSTFKSLLKDVWSSPFSEALLRGELRRSVVWDPGIVCNSGNTNVLDFVMKLDFCGFDLMYISSETIYTYAIDSSGSLENTLN